MILAPILKYLIKRNLKATDRAPIKLSGAHINRVAVVVNQSSNDFEGVKKYVKQLRARGIKVVDLFVFLANKKMVEAYPATLKDFPFCPQHFSMFGSFLSNELKHGLSEKYHVVMDLTDGSCLYADLLFSRMNTGLRVGFRNPKRDELLDMMLDTDLTSIDQSLNQLDTYLFNLNQNAA